MRFIKIRYKNFMSYGNAWTEVDLDVQGVTVLTGKNGCGKSTIIEAIHFTFFGTPFRDINKGQLVNTINNGGCVAEVEFESHAKVYKVTRGLKPTRFEVTVDGVPVPRLAKSRDMQKDFEDTVLGFGAKTFSQVVILGAASFTPFMQLKAGERRKVIEEILDISEFTPMLDASKRLASNARSRVNDARERERILEERERGCIELLRLATANSEERRVDLDREIKKLATQALSIRSANDELQKQIAESQSSVAEAEHATRMSAKGESLLQSKRGRRSALTIEIAELDNEDPCKHCGIDLTKSSREKAKVAKTAELAELDESIQILEEGLKKQKGVIEEAKKSLDAHADLKQKLAIGNSRIRDIKAAVAEKAGQLKSLESSTDVESKRDALEAVRVEITEKREQATACALDLVHYNLVSEMLRDDGVKTDIIRTHLPLINQSINNNLTMLGFPINFYLDEEFKEKIKSRGRDEFTYHQFSEGEKKRIDLAILFAWRDVAQKKNSVSTNLLIMDEVADGAMDDEGVEAFIRLLNKQCEGNSVFIVSHNPNTVNGLKGIAVRNLMATKRGLFSKLVEV